MRIVGIVDRAKRIGEHTILRRIFKLLTANPVEMLLRPGRHFPPPAVPQQGLAGLASRRDFRHLFRRFAGPRSIAERFTRLDGNPNLR